jgi:AcrR family transcriptional regulator
MVLRSKREEFGRDSRTAEGDGSERSTRHKLMVVAERLFGEFGIDAVPLRAISKEAGQRNTNSVQYHFGGKLQLLRAIFEFREEQLDPLREAMLIEGEESNRLRDVSWLLRVCFEPNFRHYRDNNGISYIKLHAQYLSNLRPRGVPHPVDDQSPSTESFRKAIHLLRQRLSFLDEQLFMSRLESVGAMFLGAIIQHAARPANGRLPPDGLFEDVLGMMTAAICKDRGDSGRSIGRRTKVPAGRAAKISS